MPNANTLKQSYDRRPFTWNISMTTLVSGAIVAIAYFIAGELSTHSSDFDAHPDIRAIIQNNGKQLNRIEANQVAQSIEKLDERICADTTNRALLKRMRELLSEYKELSGEEFPTFLLRCTNGHS